MSDHESHHADAFPTAGPPACPRCGYDVRGSMTTWTESCPVQGTCTECGLEFEWGRVLQPGRFAPLWCVEFEPRRSRIPRASLRTLMRSFRPWRFWSQVQMSHDVRPGRILAYLGCLVLSLLVLFALWRSTLATYVYLAVRSDVQNARAKVQARMNLELQRLPALRQWLAALNAFDPDDESSTWPTPDPMPGLGFDSYLKELLATDRAHWEERRTSMTERVSTWIRYHESQAAEARLIPNGFVSFPYFAALFEAVFIPLSDHSNGVVGDSSGTWLVYPAPADLLGAAFARATMTAGGNVRWNWTRDYYEIRNAILALAGSGCVLGWLIAGSMIVLPVSRGRAKVRWAHIGRVAAYSMFIPLLGLPAALTAHNLGLVFDGGRDLLITIAFCIGTLAVPAAYIVWWWMAISRYLRMPHGLLVAFLLTVMCVLLVPSVTVFLGSVLGTAR